MSKRVTGLSYLATTKLPVRDKGDEDGFNVALVVDGHKKSL
jgi:hypothetical protein